MGCGHSKLNLYSRRGNNSRKDSKKTEEAADTNDSEEEEEEEESPESIPEDIDPEDHQLDTRQHVLPITEHQPTFEVSIGQKMFFKILDEKIEQGKDYDSTSETEIREEEERKRKLIEFWHAHSQSNKSSFSQPSPPKSANKRRLTRSISKISERQCAPSTSRQCYRQESPPTRRHHSVQTHDPRPSTSTDWERDKSPLKRTQSGGPSWRTCPKVAPMPKPIKDEAVSGCSKDSQTITYNPTFQNQSPAHSANSQAYITQTVSYPLSQPIAPASPTKYIAPPEEYQDPNVTAIETKVTVSKTQSQIYYIHGSNEAAGASPDIVQQRQQTAIHLQQYVAMKQAQQQMLSYMQRSPHAVFPGGDLPASTPHMCEGEELAAQYGHPGLRPQTVRNRAHHVELAHTNTPVWSPLPPVMTTQWPEGQVPPEMQYYPQSQFVPMFRASAAGSAGTLTRYHKKEETEKTVHTISVVRAKPVGQIVAVGGQELAVSSTVSDSPSPASVSTDSGVSPGTSAPSSKSSFSGTPPTTSANETFDPKPNKKSTNKRILKASKSLDV